MILYYVSSVLLSLLALLSIIAKKKDGKIFLTIFVPILIIVFLVLVAPQEFKGEPITSLTDGQTYTKHSENYINDDLWLLLSTGNTIKNIKLYKIPVWKLRNRTKGKTLNLPERFRVDKGTVTIVKDKAFYQKVETTQVYYVTPLRDRRHNISK